MALSPFARFSPRVIKTFPIFNLGIYKGGLIIKENHLRKSHLGKIAERTIEKGIKEVAFDKGKYKYHGLIKILADSARTEGLIF